MNLMNIIEDKPFIFINPNIIVDLQELDVCNEEEAQNYLKIKEENDKKFQEFSHRSNILNTAFCFCYHI